MEPDTFHNLPGGEVTTALIPVFLFVAFGILFWIMDRNSD